ncbi:MAG: 1-acyl-sn-glycerol-3-phosphate acyltransferase [Ruminococcaceae bacterium]|nr:1-acyl-sn-glycerol-3-phosphate acyltransferase [Oscillospiraceae bacterium]
MLRTLGWVIWLFGYLVSRLPFYWKAKSLQKKGDIAGKEAAVDKQVQLWTTRLLHHLKTRVILEGVENMPPPDEPVVFACNHQSFVDIPVILDVIRPVRPILARTGIGKVPMLSGWMNLIGCIYVDRDDVRASVAALREGEAILESGRSMILFPDGTRSKGDAMGTFEPGAVRMAWKAGVRIIPIAIDGTWKVLEGNDYKIQPADVRVTILPAVEAKDLSKADQKALPGRLEEMIREAKDRAL